jgi:hypothetical protein
VRVSWDDSGRKRIVSEGSEPVRVSVNNWSETDLYTQPAG